MRSGRHHRGNARGDAVRAVRLAAEGLTIGFGLGLPGDGSGIGEVVGGEPRHPRSAVAL